MRLTKRTKFNLAHTILLSNIEGSSEFVEECKQTEKMRPTGEQVFRPIYLSSAVGPASSSSSNKHSSLNHVPGPGMREFKTSHYNAQVKLSWMGERSELKQHNKPRGCHRGGDTSHYWRDCDVDSGDDLLKQCADEFWKVRTASDRKRQGKNRKRCKSNAISVDFPKYLLLC